MKECPLVKVLAFPVDCAITGAKSRTAMQRLIRNKATHHFLGPDGQWTVDWTTAKKFPDTSALIETAVQIPEGPLEEVLIFGDSPSRFDIFLPLFRI